MGSLVIIEDEPFLFYDSYSCGDFYSCGLLPRRIGEIAMFSLLYRRVKIFDEAIIPDEFYSMDDYFFNLEKK